MLSDAEIMPAVTGSMLLIGKGMVHGGPGLIWWTGFLLQFCMRLATVRLAIARLATVRVMVSGTCSV